jgi:hypothetical protein
MESMMRLTHAAALNINQEEGVTELAEAAIALGGHVTTVE